MTLIGVDNGVTGSVCFNQDKCDHFYKTPVFHCKNYQSSKNISITRINTPILEELIQKYWKESDTYALLERPLNNPGLYTASLSAMRALEATLIVFEKFKIKYSFIDSKNWQKLYLGVDIKGRDNLKAKSKELGQLIFPDFKNDDFDGYFICLYLKDHFEKIFQRK